MIHLITGKKGYEHIQSSDQGRFNASFFGTGEYVLQFGNQCKAEYINNNTVRILDGEILMQGRHISIEPNTYEDITIQTGTAGKNRADLIVMTYIKDASNGTEDARIEVIQGEETTGTATLPSCTHGNIFEGAIINQMPLYRVDIQGVTLVSDIKPLFKSIPTYAALASMYEQEFIDACETYLDSLNILDSISNINANTESNQLAGALAVKEVIRELTNHAHDNRYFTEAEINTKLNGKSSTDHNHDSRYQLPVGAVYMGSDNAMHRCPIPYGTWIYQGTHTMEVKTLSSTDSITKAVWLRTL